MYSKVRILAVFFMGKQGNTFLNMLIIGPLQTQAEVQAAVDGGVRVEHAREVSAWPVLHLRAAPPLHQDQRGEAEARIRGPVSERQGPA